MPIEDLENPSNNVGNPDIDSNVAQVLDGTVGNANVLAWQKGLAVAINDTFSFARNNTFYALLPAYYRDYAWRYIKPACEWLDGFVWSLHNSGISGIISTRIGSKLISGLTKQIVGEKVIFKVNDRDKSDDHATLHFVSKWASENNLMKAIHSSIGFALGIGTSVIKINKSSVGELWWEAVRLDNCWLLSDFKNEIRDATFVIRNYTDTRAEKNNDQFYLLEHRYYKIYEKPDLFKKLDGTIEVIHKKGDRVPMVEYQVRRVQGTAMNNMMPTTDDSRKINWEEIPKDIRRMIKENYGVIKINDPQELGLIDLGVQTLLNGQIDLAVPTNANFGESMLVPIQDDMITYELASSYLIRDMYLGKGTVYIPKSLSLGDYAMPDFRASGGVLSDVGNDKIELLKGVSPEEQKIIVEQFQLRQAEWQSIKENCLKNIAVKWGMSPKILANFLTNGQAQMTATQIDSEDDSCIAFIYHTRSYFKSALNKLLKTTLVFYGYQDNVTLDFASPSLLNKDRLLDRVIKELDAGLTDIDDAIRTLNPDLDEEALQNKIDTAKANREAMLMSGFNEMNPDGTFGNNNVDDLGGANLNGSTLPIQ